jgi:D-sedoheptulose 7-phosphate isomerase
MKDIILDLLQESITIKQEAVGEAMETILAGARRMADCLAAGHKILFFGNGGSAADAQHLAAEFVNRFQIERPPLAALALTTDTSILTSIGNDYHFDEVFAKQVRALGSRDDVAVGISTSGNSANVLAGLQAARERGLYTIGMTGRGGKLADDADLVIRVNSDVTARVQETHIFVGHIWCELVDRILYPEHFAG